ncbi:hypothetical protein BDR05DRAFT_896909, partial [Suillus weaverae]
VEIMNVKPVASYSWIEAATPTIAVPGSPRVWFTGPQRVPADSGTRFVDQNAFYMRKMSPLVPIFAAIDVDDMDPSFDYKQFDIITDRNNLCKLLHWVSGSSDEKDFRIDVDVAGWTCLFTRLEAENTDTVKGFMGYGHEYEKAATRATRGCERATDRTEQPYDDRGSRAQRRRRSQCMGSKEIVVVSLAGIGTGTS